jgi:hypothetical protein
MMTAAEIEAGTARLREELEQFLAAVRHLGVTPELQQQVALRRDAYQEAHARMSEERRKTMRAGLSPPRRRFLLRLINLHLAFLDFAVSEYSSLLQDRAA